MTAIEQLRDEIANLHLLADRLARKQPNDEKPKVDLPTLEECEALYHEVRGSAVSFEPWKEGIAAVRALCLSRAPSPSVDIEGIVSWLKERSATPGADIEDVERVIRIKLAQYIKAAPSPSRAPRPSPQPSVEYDLYMATNRAAILSETIDSLHKMIETLAAEAGESHGVDEPVQNCAAVSRALAARDESQPSVEEMAERLYEANKALPTWERNPSTCGMTQKAMDYFRALARAVLSAPDAPKPHGIAAAPEGTEPCVYCGNENVGVEVRDDKYPGMCGFSVVCGSAFCGARGPVRPAQMDAVEEWNRAYRWVHPPKGDAPKPASDEAPFDDQEGKGPCGGTRCFLSHAGDGVWIHSSKSYGTCRERNGLTSLASIAKPASEAQGEPTLEECKTAFLTAWEKSRGPHAKACFWNKDEQAGLAAVRSLCLASRAPSPSLSTINDDLAAADYAGDAADLGLRDRAREYLQRKGWTSPSTLHAMEGFARAELARAPSPSPALAALVEAGDAMRNYFDETTLTMNRVKDKDAPGLMWALTEEYVSGATPILTDWDRARAALPKDGA